MCRVCECYRGGIVVMDVIWRQLCVNMICLFEDARGDHMEEAYTRAGFMTASIICSGLCACTEML